MHTRNKAAIAILVLGAVASFYCYTRLNAILPMSNPDAVTKIDAVIAEVHTPMVQKNQTVSEVQNDVRFIFRVEGKTIEGGYTLKDRNAAPKAGAKETIVYLTKNPRVFLRAEEYNDLPRQLSVLRILMMVFALAAIVLPFGVMKHGA